ncbi:MAG: hypothetical protein K0B07_02320 [DPANN group archaeon]|nr:hypothetical protein [DPANN group archaeon]
MIIGFMLINFMNMKTEQVCDYDNQGQCCISFVDPCISDTGVECIVGTCNTENCKNKCGNEMYCTLYPEYDILKPNELHACISEQCVGDISKCSPVECTMAAFKYDPKTKSGPEGRLWWLVLDTSNDNQCCQVVGSGAGLTKTCAGPTSP